MISKLRFSLIAVTMLVLLGFGFQNQAQGQIGLNNLFCPAVPDTTGWLETEIVGFSLVKPDFSGGLIGTVEASGGVLVGGLDWQHTDFFSSNTPTPTTESGSQLVSWWTQQNGRNSYLQVTNGGNDTVTVHVRIHNEACLEIRDFCDTYTPNDTHQYNFGDLVTNGGAMITIPGAPNEGWVAITAVQNCGSSSEVAIKHNDLTGSLIIHDSNDYAYEANMYARQGICFDIEEDVTENLVCNGSFETGGLSPWILTQGNAGVIDSSGISEEVEPPDGEFMSFIASSEKNGFESFVYLGGSFFSLARLELIETGGRGFETNVSVVESCILDPVEDNANTVSYTLSFLAQADKVCDNYAAVLLIDTTVPVIVDALCYNFTGTGSIDLVNNGSSPTCTLVTGDENAYSISPYMFGGDMTGRSNFFHDTLTIPAAGSYVVQQVTVQVPLGTVQTECTAVEDDNGALVDEFELIEMTQVFEPCDGTLDGSASAMLDVVDPITLAGQFNVLPGNATAGADVVLINIADEYGPPYRPIAAFALISVSIFDENEVDQSCGDEKVCFKRLGIDDSIVISQEITQPTTTPPTTAPPTTAPPTPPPTTGPITPPPTTTGNGGGGSSSCAIAGNPVQLGTALANILIPLVPVAFAFGVRAVRRRKK